MIEYICRNHVDYDEIDEQPPPVVNVPLPVIPPKCWEVKEGDGQRPAIQLHDYSPDDRSTSLGETNETQPHYQVIDGRIKPPKHIVNLQGTRWLEWQREILGDRNFDQKAQRGDGWEDTNDNDIPVFVDGQINPEKARKQMCGVNGGCIVNVINEVQQGGTWYSLIETMDFALEPVKVGNIWLYADTPMIWDTHPHLFNSRVNRKLVKPDNRTWISSRGVHAVSDGGLLGNKMKEWWPNPSKVTVAQPRSALRYYPALPAKIHIYKNSVIVDGNLEPQTGGIEITIDRYSFYGSKVFVRDAETALWYLADEMLVRASLLTGWYATALDYRCYATMPGNPEPWMGDRGYGIPDPGLWRKDMSIFVWLRELIGAMR